ncbi:EthD family reductase [Primorskyibacter aestuariivivens]|uniref:EthD family reductase n=1 Tax=Primorskyibacter aestuariivivens TaxID=1888912 RepID=UPI0022FFF364|nr:EthD family reductase [Primorskyibacter aestuariivivens]MDA7428451.1 EthD family reductase [Primorskyibacter aestuariivivens]
MPLSLQVIYPITDETHFDYDYYLGTHMPMVGEHMGAHIDNVLVTKGLAGGPDVPPPIYAVATMTFADQAALDAAMAAAPPVIADIANFTNTKPQMLVGEVIG